MTHKTDVARLHFENYLTVRPRAHMIKELLTGLLSENKYLPCKYLYDERGSDLFEKITRLEEYYPTRTEKQLIIAAGKVIARHFQGSHIIELGSGAPQKISLLLDGFSHQQLSKLTYIPVDVSEGTMHRAAHFLQREYPGLGIEGIIADFVTHLQHIPKGKQRLWCFLGSTLGNFSRHERALFLYALTAQMQVGDQLLLGLDNYKNEAVLQRAYNDSSGITAQFNKNVLLHVNRLLSTHFDTDDFEHVAFFNSQKYRMEMHLRAKYELAVNLPLLPNPVHFEPGETIHTENSYKFTPQQIAALVSTYDLDMLKHYTDEKKYFSLLHLVKRG